MGPWAFDDFMVDILPWRHEYITSMEVTHYFGHYILFGFLALLGILLVIFIVSSRIAPSLREAEKSKSFRKKCLKCDKETPLASEECPYCRAKQK